MTAEKMECASGIDCAAGNGNHGEREKGGQHMITGTGELKDNGQTIGRAEYKIIISQHGNTRSASGTLWADAMVIDKAFESRDLTLTRDDCGYEMSLVVDSYNSADSFASIKVSGSPGPT